jgi:poly(beta-D-mannuronate) lyase
MSWSFSMKRSTFRMMRLVVCIALPRLLTATEYRVSNNAQIIAAMSTAQPGDTLTMTNGTWTNAVILFAGSGTAEAPILLRSESYGGVILTGYSTLSISGRHLVVDGLLFRNGSSPSGPVITFKGTVLSDSCRLTNCSIIDYNPPVLTTDIDWVALYGSHNRVDHCFFRGKTNKGTVIVVWCDTTKSDYHRIDHNYFGPRTPLNDDPTKPTSFANGFETIRVGTGAVSTTNSYTVVESNYFFKCDGDAEFISNKSNGNTYRYNTFVSCQGQLSMRQGNACIIEGNFILGNHATGYRGTGGMRLTGTDHKVFNNYVSGVDNNKAGSGLALMDGTLPAVTPSYPQVRRAVVAFNTFVDNAYSISLGINNNNGTLAPDSCIIANNVVTTTVSRPLVAVFDTLTNLTWQGNLFFGGSALGIAQPNGITVSDPNMTMASDGLWRPGSGSPVVNASVSAGSFPFVVSDMDGQPRDSSPDVGADEVSATAITRRPLTPADVGPPPAMITAVEASSKGTHTIPSTLVLDQNYPNPFNPATTIRFELPGASQIELRIFDMLGRPVATLVTGRVEGGPHVAVWNASNCPSGVYFLRLQSEGRVLTKKLTLVK